MRKPTIPLLRMLLALIGLVSIGLVPVSAQGAARVPIQPGAQIETPIGLCTLNFLFQRNSKLYIGTAGHCVDEGDMVKTAGNPQVNIGPAVFSHFFEAPGVDFALIEVLDNVRHLTSPDVRTYGAPTGYTTPSNAGFGDRVVFSGYGVGFALTSITRDRTGFLLSQNQHEYTSDMPAVPGDSGGPILQVSTGKAVGVISREDLPFSTDIGPTIQAILRTLHQNGFSGLSLVTD